MGYSRPRVPRMTYYLAARIDGRLVVIRRRATSEASARGMVVAHLRETRRVEITPSELQLENVTD